MRSNDVVLGFPHDIFAFTMMQEIAARELDVEVGSYQHSVSSLHLYDDTDKLPSRTMARKFVDEGFHDIKPMPAMPKGDPWPAIAIVLDAERRLRAGELDYEPPASLDPYWNDIIILLRFYAMGKFAPDRDTKPLLGQLSFPGFGLYILDKIAKRPFPDGTTLPLFPEAETEDDANL